MQCDIKAVPEGFTTWDFVTIDGDMTCAELVEVGCMWVRGCMDALFLVVMYLT